VRRSFLVAALVSLALAGVFAALLLPSREQLRAEIRQTLINRDAAVLLPVVQERLAEHPPGHALDAETLRTLLRSGEKAGTLAMAVFDGDGNLVQAVPATLPFVDLAPADFLDLTNGRPLSRFHPNYHLQAAFGVDDALQPGVPVLELLLPLRHPREERLAGVAQYWLDARGLAEELAAADDRVRHETYLTLGIGLALIASVVGLAAWRLSRAQLELAERNERLVRANLELALAAKASALGQLTSHLLHGLQAPVAGLRAVVATRGSGSGDDWQTAADYTARLQAMIEQTVALLGEQHAQFAYELSATEVADALRARHHADAERRGLVLTIQTLGEPAPLSSDRANLLSLIATNLIDNALDASSAGDGVQVQIETNEQAWRLEVRDTGTGLPAEVQAQLFQPGRTTKPGGSGLGLAISQLLARQLGTELLVVETGPQGTTFALSLPRTPSAG